ncbi:MAG: phosphonate C-P lyase system protein PhnL [Desulfobulbaceae bacterium A2]|nr:MAG: phosphonate C-P lyase system protein PhnL [Desulfobulbaceae bacterium A2]
MATMLIVRQLCKNFTIHALGGEIIGALADVSFEVARGDFLALAGPSGAGKSSILKCIYRTYLPNGGSVLYDSAAFGRVDLVRLPERQVITIRQREMGYVAQFLQVIPRVSALDLVAEPLRRRHGLSVEEARERAASLLARLRIPARLFDASPATFSGGEQQRVNIARAICWQPRLMLLDEPTASLDADSIDIVLELLMELRQAGTTMIGIFHDPAVMERIASHIYHIGREGMDGHA